MEFESFWLDQGEDLSEYSCPSRMRTDPHVQFLKGEVQKLIHLDEVYDWFQKHEGSSSLRKEKQGIQNANQKCMTNSNITYFLTFKYDILRRIEEGKHGRIPLHGQKISYNFKLKQFCQIQAHVDNTKCPTCCNDANQQSKPRRCCWLRCRARARVGECKS